MPARFNPFRPNNMVNPAMFVGRVDELKTIEQCLFQTKNGNPQHFIVQGERGIGKSSLFLYVERLAQGGITAFTGEKFKFLVVSTDLGGCDTPMSVIRKLGRGLKQSLTTHEAARERAKDFLTWLLNWEILGVRFHKEAIDIDTEEAAEEFVIKLSEFCQQSDGFLDGIVILIDEADGPTAQAGLGALLKLLTERLARRGCNRVLFGLAGLPVLLGKLRESHESSPRLFETMLLEALEVSERKRVVSIGLSEAKKKNGYEVIITAEAADFLADLSEGYPHFVQQFAYCAFDQDTDNQIDEEDVGEGAFKEGGALSQLGDKFFNDMYHARISSEDYRRVLDAMAEHGDTWVSRATIISESGVTETKVNNALQALKSKEVILQDEKRRGHYRLPTNSFAAWINAIRAARAKSDALHGTGFSG